jgi:hypothetical protein
MPGIRIMVAMLSSGLELGASAVVPVGRGFDPLLGYFM